MSSLENMSNWQLYQSFTDINKKLWTKLQLARRRNQIPSTSETNLYFANNMLIDFVFSRQQYLCTALANFLAVTVCKFKPEILNIMKYALIVHLDNQWIFYNINKNFWLMLTHCENKSWENCCPCSFLSCNQCIMFCALVQPDLVETSGVIKFPSTQHITINAHTISNISPPSPQI